MALNFVVDPDYTLLMDIQHQINLDHLLLFADERIRFPFPTQTLYLEVPRRRALLQPAGGEAP